MQREENAHTARVKRFKKLYEDLHDQWQEQFFKLLDYETYLQLYAGEAVPGEFAEIEEEIAEKYPVLWREISEWREGMHVDLVELRQAVKYLQFVLAASRPSTGMPLVGESEAHVVKRLILSIEDEIGTLEQAALSAFQSRRQGAPLEGDREIVQDEP